MPPLPATPALKVEAFYSVSGTVRDIVNIWHITYSGGPPTGGLLASYLALLDGKIDDFTTTFMHTSATHVRTRLTDLSSSTGAVVESTPGTAGGNSGTLAPLSVAAVASWHVARRYRGGHPRTYLGAMSDAQLVPPQSLHPTFITNFQTAANTFIGNVAGLAGTLPGSTLIAVSYRTGGALRVTPLQEVILSATVHSRIDSQRRRLGKEGV